MEEISNNDLLAECQEIYDFNLKALSTHVYTLMCAANRRKINYSKIIRDLDNQKNIDTYRLFLFKVMDSFKTEIEEYKDITKFQIRGTHASLLYCFENKKVIDKLDIIQKSRLEKELVEVIYYAENLLKEVQK